MFLLITVVYITAGFLGGLLFYTLCPGFFFPNYYVIIVFYWIIGVITNYLLDNASRTRLDKLLSIYMMSRVIKFLLMILFLALFIKLVIDYAHRVPFVIALMGNYLLYTFLELYIYYLYNKRALKNGKDA